MPLNICVINVSRVFISTIFVKQAITYSANLTCTLRIVYLYMYMNCAHSFPVYECTIHIIKSTSYIRTNKYNCNRLMFVFLPYTYTNEYKRNFQPPPIPHIYKYIIISQIFYEESFKSTINFLCSTQQAFENSNLNPQNTSHSILLCRGSRKFSAKCLICHKSYLQQ